MDRNRIFIRSVRGAIHEITCGKYEITEMKIKLVTIQITYFCGVIQSEITTAKRKRNGSAEKLQVTSEERYFLFHN